MSCRVSSIWSGLGLAFDLECLVSSRLFLSRLVSSCLVSSRLVSSCLVSSCLVFFCLVDLLTCRYFVLSRLLLSGLGLAFDLECLVSSSLVGGCVVCCLPGEAEGCVVIVLCAVLCVAFSCLSCLVCLVLSLSCRVVSCLFLARRSLDLSIFCLVVSRQSGLGLAWLSKAE